MALADILEAIRREADEELAAVAADADRLAASIREGARADAAVAEAEAAGGRDDELRAAAGELLRGAALDAARMVREAREEIFQRALEGVRRRLDVLRCDERYGAVFLGLLEESMAALPEATTVMVDRGDVELVARLLDRLDVAVHVDASLVTAGGVRVATADGRSVDDTFETRLARAEPELRRLLVLAVPALIPEGHAGG